MSVREVTEEDRDALAGVLARAFDDDPVTRWVYGDGETRQAAAERFFDWQLGRLTGQDVSWTTTANEGAALWALPGRWRERPVELLRLLAMTFSSVGRHAPRVLRGLAQIERRHPGEPHLYLAVLGVDPDRQGTGIGSALMAPGLELCDREGLPAFLETATERNVAFYTRHGFRVANELALPSGPPVWLMWREPT